MLVRKGRFIKLCRRNVRVGVGVDASSIRVADRVGSVLFETVFLQEDLQISSGNLIDCATLQGNVIDAYRAFPTKSAIDATSRWPHHYP